MIRALLLIWALAPFQCASDPDPNHRLEDSPGEALWNLSERFAQEGDEQARRVTLEQLVEYYPGSRYARHANAALGRAGDSDAVTSDDASDEEATSGNTHSERADERATEPAASEDVASAP